MTLTTTKSWKNYITLCRMLEKNDIPFESDDSSLSVQCRVSGREAEIGFLLRIDPSKMLISLYSPLCVHISGDRLPDIALGIAMINSTLDDGVFCLDKKLQQLYFRMTTSFYESNISGTLFEYMLCYAADAIDEYYPRLLRLAESEMPA